MPDNKPTQENPDDGPECPDCGGETEFWVNQLTEDEHTTSISCTECDFEIESESNLAAKDREERWADQIDHSAFGQHR